MQLRWKLVEIKDQKITSEKKVRALCDKKKIILIFDECSSGFRQSFGGLHKLFGVNPDMAWFGKALGNGYGITAIIGKREIMDHAQNSFISSTFWTERSGPVAANKTLEIMEKTRSWEKITKIGREIQDKWKSIAKRHNLKFKLMEFQPYLHLASYQMIG